MNSVFWPVPPSSSMSRTMELVLYVYARPAGNTEQESLAVFKREVERLKDIESLVAMRFGDFRKALDQTF